MDFRVGLLVILLPCWGCGDGSVREAAPEATCEHRLQSVGAALRQYRQEHGVLPPSEFVDSGGYSHSWRILVLPYCLAGTSGEESMRGYGFDQPWNSPNNLSWARESCNGSLFHCRADGKSADDLRTSYLMLVRPDRDDGRYDILPEDAVVVVECAGCEVNWLEPKDIELEELFEAPSPFGIGRLNSNHSDVVKAIRVDGTVVDIPKNATKAEVRALLDGASH